jgi:hypothetical protein
MTDSGNTPAFDASKHRASTGGTEDRTLPMPLRHFDRGNAGAVHKGRPWRPPHSLPSPTPVSSSCHLSSLDRSTASLWSLRAKTSASYLASSGVWCFLPLAFQFAASRCRRLCWFLDAGNNERPARSTGRRPKSAKARSRGKLGTG